MDISNIDRRTIKCALVMGLTLIIVDRLAQFALGWEPMGAGVICFTAIGFSLLVKKGVLFPEKYAGSKVERKN